MSEGESKPDLGHYRIEIIDDRGLPTILDPGGPFYIHFKGEFIDYYFAGLAVERLRVIKC